MSDGFERSGLPRPEWEQIYSSDIAREWFGQKVPSSQPKSVFLGGQPGAGKSSGSKLIAQRYPGESFATLDGDKLRPFHPRYQSFMDVDMMRMSEHTNAAMGQWLQMGRDQANEQGYSTIWEGTWSKPHHVVEAVDQAQAHGRHIDAVVMAVPPDMSRAGMLKRFFERFDKTGQSRYVPVGFHDAAVEGLRASVGELAAHPGVASMTVVDRAGNQLYYSDQPGEQRRRQACAVMEAEHSRGLTEAENTQLRQELSLVVDVHRRRTAGIPELDEACRWAEGKLAELPSEPSQGPHDGVEDAATAQALHHSPPQRTQTAPVHKNPTQQGLAQELGEQQNQTATQQQPDPMGPCPPGMNEQAWEAQKMRLMSNPIPANQIRRADRSHRKTGTAAARTRRQATHRQTRHSTGRGD